MVFGNLDDQFGVGVGFSRDSATGERRPSGQYRAVADHPTTAYRYEGLDALAAVDPGSYQQLTSALANYETDRRDLVRLDYVREMGRLWIVDGRVAERAPEAATRVVVDLVAEGTITKADAIRQLDTRHVSAMLHTRLAPGDLPTPTARGNGASPGCATGMVVLDSTAAMDAVAAGRSVILVKRETTPEDVETIRAVAGVLTSHGGRLRTPRSCPAAWEHLQSQAVTTCSSTTRPPASPGARSRSTPATPSQLTVRPAGSIRGRSR